MHVYRKPEDDGTLPLVAHLAANGEEFSPGIPMMEGDRLIFEGSFFMSFSEFDRIMRGDPSED